MLQGKKKDENNNVIAFFNALQQNVKRRHKA
jgi:hypothetical protein